MTKPYVLSPESVLKLATGEWDLATAQTLFSAQTSINNLLAAHVIKSLGTGRHLEHATAVLSAAQARAPRTTTVLCHEAWMGIWIARGLDALRRPESNRAELNRLSARIGGVAAVAAMHAGLDAETTTVADNGCVLLPTLGAFLLPATHTVPVRLLVRDGTMKLYVGETVFALPHDDASPTGNWLPMRHLTADYDGYELDLVFDDLDPLRDCYGEQVTGRVPDELFADWEELFLAGWRLLRASSPQRAAELSYGMRVLVPLAQVPERSGISVTSQDAMGALAMTLPIDRAHMAIALVHEQAHSTLNGLLNLVPLFDRGNQTRYYAPWRADPRPIGGLLHGTYAFHAVTETWLKLSADPDLEQTALNEFALRRAQLDLAVDTLVSVDSWTPSGREFVSGLRLRCDALLAEWIPANIAKRAEEALREEHRHWRQRNHQ